MKLRYSDPRPIAQRTVVSVALCAAVLSAAAIVLGASRSGMKTPIILLAALIPYVGAVTLSRTQPLFRRWPLVAIAVYAPLDLAVRLQAVLHPENTENLFLAFFLLLFVAPVAAGCASIGTWLWRVKGRVALACWLLVLMAASAVAYYKEFYPDELPRIAVILNLPAMPLSTNAARCQDTGFRDTQVDCYFDVDPAEFPELVSGRAFTQKPDSGMAHARWPNLGPEFEIAVAHSVAWETEEPGFKHQHNIFLHADAARQHVIVSYSGY